VSKRLVITRVVTTDRNQASDGAILKAFEDHL